MNQNSDSSRYLVPVSIVVIIVLMFVLTMFTTNVAAQTSTNFIPENQQTDLNNRTQIRIRLKDLRDRSDKELSAEQKTALIEQFKALPDRAKCEIRQRNIQARIEYYELARSEQANALRAVIENVQTAIERQKRLETDTAKFAAHVAELTKFSDQLRNNYFTLSDAISKLAETVCDVKTLDNPELKAVQVQLENLRKINEQVRTYLKEKVLPDLVVAASTSSVTSETN